MRICRYCNKGINNPGRTQLYHPECKQLKKNEDSRKRMKLIYDAKLKVNPEKVCICGKTFFTDGTNRKYCSHICYRASVNKRALQHYYEPKEELNKQLPAWGIPTPSPLPKYSTMLRRIFDELRKGETA